LTERVHTLAVLFFTLTLFPMFLRDVHADSRHAWAGEFLRMGAGARSLAMGNAYNAVEGDIYSSYYNPAGLASMEGMQFAVSHRYMTMDRRFIHLGIGGPAGPDAGFAFSWIGAGTDGIQGRDLNGNRTGSLEDSRNSFAVTFSKYFGPRVSAGVNAKISLWKLAGEDAKAVGFDGGVIIKPVKNLSCSFVLRDLGSRFTWNSGRWADLISGADGQTVEKEDKLPVYMTAGLAYRPMGEKLLFSLAAESVEDDPIGYDLGIAWRYNWMFTLRGGVYNYSFSDGLDYGSLTAGFGLQATNMIGLDYAFATDFIENDRVHVISLNLTMPND